MLHPLPKNVYSSRLVSTLAITTHPDQDAARITQGLLLTSSRVAKSQKRSPAACAPYIAMAHPRIRDPNFQIPCFLVGRFHDSRILLRKFQIPRFRVRADS